MGVIIGHSNLRHVNIGVFDGFLRIPGCKMFFDPAVAVKDGSDNFVSLLDKSVNNFNLVPSSTAPKVTNDRGFPCVESTVNGSRVIVSPVVEGRNKMKFMHDGSPWSAFAVVYVDTSSSTAGHFYSPIETRVSTPQETGARGLIGIRTNVSTARTIGVTIFSGNTNIGSTPSSNVSYSVGETFIVEFLCRGYLDSGNDLETLKNNVSVGVLANFNFPPDMGLCSRAVLCELNGAPATIRNYITLSYNWTGLSSVDRDFYRQRVYDLLVTKYGALVP